MLPKLLFWSGVAIDAIAVAVLFVLGLAAAGPSRTNPLLVALAMLVVPGSLLGVAIFLFLRSPNHWLRMLACAVVMGPIVHLA